MIPSLPKVIILCTFALMVSIVTHKTFGSEHEYIAKIGIFLTVHFILSILLKENTSDYESPRCFPMYFLSVSFSIFKVFDVLF